MPASCPVPEPGYSQQVGIGSQGAQQWVAYPPLSVTKEAGFGMMSCIGNGRHHHHHHSGLRIMCIQNDYDVASFGLSLEQLQYWSHHPTEPGVPDCGFGLGEELMVGQWAAHCLGPTLVGLWAGHSVSLSRPYPRM